MDSLKGLVGLTEWAEVVEAARARPGGAKRAKLERDALMLQRDVADR